MEREEEEESHGRGKRGKKTAPDIVQQATLMFKNYPDPEGLL